MMTPLKPFVSVCVCTYKRPGLLARLLESLAEQSYGQANFEIVIADNDATASAQQVVEDFAQQHPKLPIRYEVEAQQGISFARNCTVNMARGEWLALIDDDEFAVPQWLSALVSTQQKYGADAVMGPVLPIYPKQTARWVIQSRFFERPHFKTGTSLPWRETRAGNALVKANWAKQRKPIAFDISLAKSGGEDTDFFRWIEERGARFVWCDTAAVSEEVPLHRQTLRFMLERSFRSSVTYWRTLYPQHSCAWRYREAAWGACGGVGMVILGVLKLPLGLGHAAPIWSKGMKAFGRVAALSRVQLVGYK